MLEGEDSADDDGSKGAELFKKLYRGKKPQKDDSDEYGSENEGKISSFHGVEPEELRLSLEEKKINKIAESVVRDQEMQKKERILSRKNIVSGGKPSKGKSSKNSNRHLELEHHINDEI